MIEVRPPPKLLSTRPPLNVPLRERITSGKKKIWATIVVISVIISLIVGCLALAPRLSVEASNSIDPAQPFPIKFTITNTGYVTLRNVQPSVGLCKYLYSKAVGDEPITVRSKASTCGGETLAHLTLSDDFARQLVPGEPLQIRVDDTFRTYFGPGQIFVSADISILVEYRVWFIPWTKHDERRFVTRKEADGRLSWVPVPLGK